MQRAAMFVTLPACLALCLATCHYSLQAGASPGEQRPGAPPDITLMTDKADVIIVGSHPVESRRVTPSGRVLGVIGYRIDALRFIKGANTVRLSHPHVSIDMVQLAQTDEVPVLPAKTGRDDRFIYFLAEQRASFSSSPRWKPIKHGAWFVPASQEAIKQIEEALPQAQVWGQPSNGLTAGIRTLKPTYVSGEPVGIELHLKNTSDHTLLVPQQRLLFNDHYPFLEFSGGTGVKVFFQKPAGIGQKDAMPPVSLRPGQVHVERINLDSWQWSSTDGLQPFRSGVSLTMHGFLTVRELDKDFDYSNADAAAMWRGLLEIPRFEIILSPGQIPPAGITSQAE